jgi:uncharacterized membrane protein
MPEETLIAQAEGFVSVGVLWLKLVVEVAGASVIGLGLLVAIFIYIRGIRSTPRQNLFGETRLTFARFLALALELQLGADILGTAVAPSWDQIGKLAAIAVIRTVLNHFLMRELHEEHVEPTPHLAKKSEH